MGYNHFSYTPSSVTSDRSQFKFSKQIVKGVQLGWLYPMCKPVFMYPGSTLNIKHLGMEIRSNALIAPLTTELLCDVFAFNVPNRIVWEHWKQFLGAVDDVLFDNLSEYQIPNFKYAMCLLDGNGGALSRQQFVSGQENYQWNQCIACHFELPYPRITSDPTQEQEPTAPEYVSISALPFRGYNFIVNEFFLPEYLSFRILFSKTDDGWSGDNMIPMTGYAAWDRWIGVDTLGPAGSLAADYGTVGGVIYPVSRAHRSLYTSCLPKPSLETLNLLGTVDNAPVGYVPAASGTLSSASYNLVASGSALVSGTFKQSSFQDGGVSGAGAPAVAKINEAVLTVNNYRETILLQNYYDTLNRAGSRYDEIIANLFHTRTSFAVISIPELIVHKRFSIYRKEVVATAQTNNGGSVVKPVGSQSAYIDTVIRDSFFIKSTTEHGYIHMLMCIRPARIVMTSGFEPDWLRLNKVDQFYPQFQGMGDVPRKKMEATYGFSGSYDSKDAVLGYQEYSADDKYQRSSAVGWFDPHTPNSIPGYVISDYYEHTNEISLNNYYLSCASEEVQFAKCLAIPDPTVAPQFICDIRLEGEIIHPMKVYNIPGQGDLL